jgi:hypothetical protein
MAKLTVKEWAVKAAKNVDEVVITTCIDISRRVVLYTPVGDPKLWKSPPPAGYTGGQAKGNWIASINSPSSSVSQLKDPKGALTVSLAEDQAVKAPGNVFYLVNNLPYIRRLEYEAWSSQAPAGMIRRVMAEAPAIVRDVIQVVKRK